MEKQYQSVRGMNDILPEDSHSWIDFETLIAEWLTSYGYLQIRTPILEQTQLFLRSIGNETDIVKKEMYTFTDQLNEESLTLRPEGTASTLRALIEHHLLYNSTQRVWYMGPMFRHERPQKGRYRQFHQVGVEALGFTGPDIDAEMILMTASLWKKLGLTQEIELQINTLGNALERKNYKEQLVEYFTLHQDLLDEESKRRLNTNPLRILDSKNKDIQSICKNAPKLLEYLGEESLNHYQELKNLLNAFGVSFKENPLLVRGLDYYNLSVFEWVDVSSSPLTFCAGGRYNGLIEELGGKDTPGIGFAMGVERVLAMMEISQSIKEPPALDCYVIHKGEGTTAFALSVANFVRKLGYNVKQDFEGTSFKSQMQRANHHRSKIAIIIGENELQTRSITVKSLNHKVDQQTISLDQLPDYLKDNQTLLQ